MDERYLLTATQYGEWNPVRAKVVRRPEQFRWSRAPAHLRGEVDVLVKVAPFRSLNPDWSAFLDTSMSENEWTRLRGHERTGRPVVRHGRKNGQRAGIGRSPAGAGMAKKPPLNANGKASLSDHRT